MKHVQTVVGAQAPACMSNLFPLANEGKLGLRQEFPHSQGTMWHVKES